MENYLQHMKTLRSQMNDVEDQAAKISFEEQSQVTTIQTMEKDLNAAKTEARQLKEDVEQMLKAEGQVCSRILDKQRKIVSLESDILKLTQTLELLQQEQVNLSAKLAEKSAYYSKVAEDINTKLLEQKNWIDSNKASGEMVQLRLIKDKSSVEFKGTEGKSSIGKDGNMDRLENEAQQNLMAELESAKAKLKGIAERNSKLDIENKKMKQYLEHLRCKAKDFKPELVVMDLETLEEGYEALLLDKSGETEYLQSLQDQIQKLKGISCEIKCGCGNEYKMKMDLHHDTM